MPFNLNLNFADNLTTWQKTAITDAAKEYADHFRDNTSVNLFFANSDNFESGIAGGAIPNFVGGLDQSDLDYAAPNGTADIYDNDFWTQAYRADGRISFEQYHTALAQDAKSGSDTVFVNSLTNEMVTVAGEKTVNFYNSAKGITDIKGIQTTSAAAKALGLNVWSNGIDGVIALNPFNNIDQVTSKYYAEYRQLDHFGTSYNGEIRIHNNTNRDATGSITYGFFDVDGRITSSWGVGEGGLAIFRETALANGRYRYSFKTNDTNFKAGETNYLGFTVQKSSATASDVPIAVSLNNNLVNNVRYLDPTGTTPSIKLDVYGEENPVGVTYEEYKALVTHEIGHALGFTSATDQVAPEIGKYAVKPYTLDTLTNLELNLLTEEAFRINPLDLTRFTNFGGTIGLKRSLTPQIEGSVVGDVYFSFNGQGTISGYFATGKALNTIDYLTGQGTYYYQGSHWKENSGTGIMQSTYEDLTQFTGLSTNDLRAFDLIGYDVWYSGGAGGTVTTQTWNNVFDVNVKNVLEGRTLRAASSTVRSSSENILSAEYADILENAGVNYTEFLKELAQDLGTF